MERKVEVSVRKLSALVAAALFCAACHGNYGGPATDAPKIVLSRSEVTFATVAKGDNPAAEDVSITNGAAGALAGLDAKIVYPADQPDGWLASALSDAAAPAIVRLQPNIINLSPGTYSAEIVVAAPDAENTPQSLTVTMTVAEAPAP